MTPDVVTLEQAIELVNAKAAQGGGKKKAAAKKPAAKKPAAKKKAPAKKTAKPKPSES
jgi:DNA topoisomerase-1